MDSGMSLPFPTLSGVALGGACTTPAIGVLRPEHAGEYSIEGKSYDDDPRLLEGTGKERWTLQRSR